MARKYSLELAMDKYISVKELEHAALESLPKATRDYYKSGATEEYSLADNRQAFQRLRIRPKCLIDVKKCDLSTVVLGEKVSMPLGISPTAMQRMAHPDGETANVKAAEAEGVIYTLSTFATSSIEEVAEAAPNAVKWFQIFIHAEREATRKLVLRAEQAGFKALALTVDTPIFGLRRADIHNKFTLPRHLRLANFDGAMSTKICIAGEGSALNNYVKSLLDQSLTWDEIKWLKSITKLPIVAKGILRADDAVKAAKAGCAGILISNHGARQLDGVPSTIEALPEIVEAVKNYNIEVFMDGGVTTGTDVYKALALGAKMVFVGRPALWGLTVGGQDGVQRMLSIFRNELEYRYIPYCGLRIRPKCLIDVKKCDLSTVVLGEKVSMPLGISPTAMQRMAHPDGETANVKAAEAEGVIYTLSTFATSSIEEVAEAAPNAVKWFQIFIHAEREATRKLVLRAEQAGFKALALTVDTPIFGLRRADIHNKFTLPRHLRLANFDGAMSTKICIAGEGSALNNYVKSLLDQSLTWDEIKWLKSITKLPIVAKGILRADDAVKAAKAGCAGILISNHGARQLDGVPSTIEALPEIVEAVKNYNIEVFMDGGVTTGTDVYKALALGAKMVFVGRPALWGLTVGGQDGVQRMLSIFRNELEYRYIPYCGYTNCC